MDAYEKVGYSILGFVALLWIFGMVAGAIAALPYGLAGLLGFVGIGALLIKVIRERLNNTEDDYYSKNVDR
jgi:hypothetical protein